MQIFKSLLGSWLIFGPPASPGSHLLVKPDPPVFLSTLWTSERIIPVRSFPVRYLESISAVSSQELWLIQVVIGGVETEGEGEGH